MAWSMAYVPKRLEMVSRIVCYIGCRINSRTHQQEVRVRLYR